MTKAKNTPAPESLEQALKVIAEQEATIDSLLAESAENQKIIVDLNKQVSKLEQANAAGEQIATVEIGKQTYQINSATRLDGVILTPKQIAENVDAAKAILEIEGQQVLTLITE